MECLFCKIVNNEIPSYTIFEDELVKVFLDISPSTNGDCLVIPKKHYDNFIDIPNDSILHIHNVSKYIYTILKRGLNIDGLTLAQNNFYGQEIKHYHLHLTPRYKNDNLRHSFNKEILIEITKIFEQIKNN